MAYDLVEKLNNTNNEIILQQLSDAVNTSDKKRGKLHEVFEPSFDIKERFTEKFIIHLPWFVSPRTGMVENIKSDGNFISNTYIY